MQMFKKNYRNLSGMHMRLLLRNGVVPKKSAIQKKFQFKIILLYYIQM